MPGAILSKFLTAYRIEEEMRRTQSKLADPGHHLHANRYQKTRLLVSTWHAEQTSSTDDVKNTILDCSKGR